MMKSSICTLLMCLTISVMAQEDFVQHNLIDEYLTGFEVGDFDNDGDLDVFGVWLRYQAPNRIFLYRNVGGEGADLFQKEIIDLENEGGHHIALADMDNDGDLDAVLSGEDTNNIVLFSNNGDGTFTEIPLGVTGGTQVEVADYEGDGDLDIITLDTENKRVYVHIDNGGNQFSTLTSKTVADDPEDISLGDMDGDGDTDIALVFGLSFGKQVVVLENKGFTILTEKVVFEDDLRSADEIYIADMNNDNRQDMVVLDQERILIFTNLGNLSFDFQSYEDPNNTSDFLTGLGLGDFNGDGKIDMCVSDFSQSEIVWFKNNYANGIYDFQVAGEVGRYTGARNFRSADFDLDGDLDVVSTAADFAWHENQVTQIEPPFTVFDAISESPDHTTLETAIIAAELSVDLDNEGAIFTIFAPTDAAFNQLPAGVLDALLDDPMGELKDILLYHVLDTNVPSSDLMNGQTVMTLNGKDITITIDNNEVFINEAQVTVADIMTDNGVVHVIDAVLMIPRTTIFDIIQDSPNHTVLETAILAAGLDDELEGEELLTVFAPTDAAFAQLPAGALNALLDDPMGALAQTLLYHVVDGNVLSTDLMDGQSVVTLNGESLTIAINNNTISINDSEVTVANIETDNGVVHVVSTVIQPPNSTKDIATIQLNTYPNPVTDLLTIEMPNEILGQAVTALLIDNLGITIKSFTLTENVNTILVSDIPAGIYHLSIEAKNTRAYQLISIH